MCTARQFIYITGTVATRTNTKLATVAMAAGCNMELCPNPLSRVSEILTVHQDRVSIVPASKYVAGCCEDAVFSVSIPNALLFQWKEQGDQAVRHLNDAISKRVKLKLGGKRIAELLRRKISDVSSSYTKAKGAKKEDIMRASQ